MRAKAVYEGIVERHPASAHFVSLYGQFCDDVLPTANVTDDASALALASVPGSAFRRCTRFVPGTNVFAFKETVSGHLNAVGALYMWPFLCSAMEAEGLM